MARTATAKSVTEERPYAAFADRLNEWILTHRMRNLRTPYVQRVAALAMGINPTTFSKLIRGRELPSPNQCLAIARYFGVGVEDVLRMAGYPDLQGIIAQVRKGAGGDERERKVVLDILEMAQASPLWQKVNVDSPYKQRADEILASDTDPYRKAVSYADNVWNWYHDHGRDTPRWQRKTDELATIVS